MLIIMIPNSIYVVKAHREENLSKYLIYLEQIGRYGCVVLMWLLFLGWKFEFTNKNSFTICFTLSTLLIFIYYLVWTKYSERKFLANASTFAGILTIVFFYFRMHASALFISSKFFNFWKCPYEDYIYHP